MRPGFHVPPLVVPATTGTHTPKSRSAIQPFSESGGVVEYDFVMFAHTIAAIGRSGL